MRTDSNGQGVINLLAADRLINQPKLYAIFLLWLLAELFEQLPEVGDVDKPKLVFSLMRPICCLPMPRLRWWIKLSKWYG